MNRRVIDVPGLYHGRQPIPVAVEKDGVIATGGISGTDPATGQIPADLEQEIAQVYRNIGAIIDAAGASPDDIVRIGFLVADRDVRPLINPGWLELFPDPASRPARHTVVQALAPGVRVQAELIAVHTGQGRARTLGAPDGLSAATVHEASGQLGFLPSEIKPVTLNRRARGPAFTVSCSPRDNLALHHAIAAAPPGSVLVCHTGGCYDAGYFGDVMATAAAARGIVALVIDGCVRDLAQISTGPVAVFSRGLSVHGTTKDPLLPGAIGCRLRIGETDIDPDDLIIADEDGVVVVPGAQLAAVLEASDDREAKEAAIRRRLNDGELTVGIYGLPPLRTDHVGTA